MNRPPGEVVSSIHCQLGIPATVRRNISTDSSGDLSQFNGFNFSESDRVDATFVVKSRLQSSIENANSAPATKKAADIQSIDFALG